MNASPKNLLIGFLALTTVSASALAWQQYRKLRSLQVTSTLASTERAEWQKRVWDAEKRAAPPPGRSRLRWSLVPTPPCLQMLRRRLPGREAAAVTRWLPC